MIADRSLHGPTKASREGRSSVCPVALGDSRLPVAGKILRKRVEVFRAVGSHAGYQAIPCDHFRKDRARLPGKGLKVGEKDLHLPTPLGQIPLQGKARSTTACPSCRGLSVLPLPASRCEAP